METEKKKLTILLDASALKESSCMLRTFYNIIKGYRAKVNSNDIEFGSAFHLCAKRVALDGNLGKGVQEALAYFKNTPMDVKPKKAYLSSTYLSTVCISWFQDMWETDSFDILRYDAECKHCVGWANAEIPVPEVCPNCNNTGKVSLPFAELKFAYPYYSDDSVEIVLMGTIDKVGQFRRGILAVGDYKTTSKWDVEEYLKGYEMSCQLIFYIWNMKKYIELSNNPVLEKYKGQEIGAFIDGIFLASAEANGKNSSAANGQTRFQRSEVFQPNESDMKEFERLLNKKVMEIVGMAHDYLKGTEPGREGIINGACQTIYGKCKYFLPCTFGSDTISREHVIKRNFVTVPYNPHKFGEVV